MPGLKVSLPTSFSDTTLPVLRDDAMLTAGSLFLTEPAHPVASWKAGVPNVGDALPNVAWKEAANVLGAGSQSSLAGVLKAGPSASQANMDSKAYCLRERSALGGYHFIGSQSATATQMAYTTHSVGLPAAILDYMFNNPQHAYFMALWGRMTRKPASGGANVCIAQLLGQSGSISDAMFYYYIRPGAGDLCYPVANPPRLGYRAPAMGTAPFALQYNMASQRASAFAAGNNTNTPVVLGALNSESVVLYRVYVEDLTVSGRSYAAVDALDSSEFTRLVASSGGRYYGDTYTDPATLS